MAQGYRTLQHWNQWLSNEFLGVSLLEFEQQILTRLLTRHLGKHALLIGVPQQAQLLNATKPPCHALVSPLVHGQKKHGFVEGDFHELPILTGSIDLVLMPHALEFVDNPRQLLSEACRIVKPEGLIAICGFNPYSAWGAKKRFIKNKTGPWGGHFIHANKIKAWLQLADFALEQEKFLLFRPPLTNKNLFQQLAFIERIGNKLFPLLGGVYVLIARAKVIPLTPIRLKWKQQINGIRISPTITSHIA